MPALKLNTKSQQLDKTQATMLAIVVIASIICVFSLVAAKSFLSQASYLNRVATEKEKAVKQLKSNKEAVGKLDASYQAFASQNPNLLGGDSTDSKSGDNGRLVLDALPSKYDFPALTTSIEKMLANYTINSIEGSDDSAAQESAAAATTPVEMPFNLSVTSNYADFNRLLVSFEKSIRPFQMQKMTISGTNGTLKADMSAKSFYQPEVNLNVEKKVVK